MYHWGGNYGNAPPNGGGIGNFLSGHSGDIMGGLGDILAGIFGHPERPYQAEMGQYQQALGQGIGYQQPFYQAGVGAIPQYQNWLAQEQDPVAFMNRLMSQYQQSPYAKQETDAAMRALQNQASASGLIGSTPYMQAGEQTARDIAAQDMQSWLANVLGINTQYGQGQQTLMQGGQQSANAITNMIGQYGKNMAQTAGQQQAARQSNFGNILGGALKLAGTFL